MRKGIVATIVIYSLVQILGAIIVFTSLYIILPIDNIIVFGMYALSYIIGFILLAIHVNKKYTNEVKYWKFITVGVIISIILSIFLTITSTCLYPSSNPSDMIRHFTNGLKYYPAGFISSALIICSVIGFFSIIMKNNE
ncbi:MAG: hypothetical protein HRT73_05630 [Flavobacteriales bacterium]|nr:hypothetical protein [Flavobacteriales bacterium]